MSNVIMTIKNPDAIESLIEFEIEESAFAYICRWYGGFHGGDNYKIFKDYVEVSLDINGETK